MKKELPKIEINTQVLTIERPAEDLPPKPFIIIDTGKNSLTFYFGKVYRVLKRFGEVWLQARGIFVLDLLRLLTLYGESCSIEEFCLWGEVIRNPYSAMGRIRNRPCLRVKLTQKTS